MCFVHFIAAPPAPTGFRNTITRSNSESLNLDFIWDAPFNAENSVGIYRLVANDSSVSCPQTCSSISDLCQCPGFTAGVNVNINVSAVSCGDLEGPTFTISVTPQGLSAAY